MTRFSLTLAAALIGLGSLTHAGDVKQDNGIAIPVHHVGALTLEAPFTRATLPNQPVAGAFLTITNAGSEDDVLVAVSSPIAARGEVHEMAMAGDTMKMRHLTDGLVIPAGGSVTLQPGGYHLMFMELNQPLVEGGSIDITLEFRDAGTLTVPFSIQGKGARSMDHADDS